MKQRLLTARSASLHRVTFPVTVSLPDQSFDTQITGWVCRPTWPQHGFVPLFQEAWQQAQHQAREEAASLPSCWLLAIPGATYGGRSYFDRQVPGYASETFSLARALASRGVGLVLIDTLGTGESACPDLDGRTITSELTRRVNAQVLAQMRTRLRNGTLVEGMPAVSPQRLWLGAMGHSLGALQMLSLASAVQEQGDPFDGIIVAGLAYVQVREAVVPAMEELTPFISEQGFLLPDPELRRLFHPLFFHPLLSDAVVAADDADALPLPLGLLRDIREPATRTRLQALAGQVRSPVLHTLAEIDLSDQLAPQLACYASAPLVSGYVQPQAAHCNFEASRTQYWHVLASWVWQVALLRQTALAA